MMWCKDCEAIQNSFFEKTTFWIYMPTTDCFGKIAAFCGKYGYEATQFNSHCIKVTLSKNKIDPFLTALYGEINLQERKATKIITTSGPEPGVADMGRIMNADVFINRFKSNWIVQAIENKSYETWFQPIVSAHNPTSEKPFAFEGLFRMRDEAKTIMPPSYVFELASHSDLLFSLDLIARRSAVECASKAGLKSKIFINFNPTSIYDPSFCLRTTAAAISELGFSPGDIVFEITETHRATDKAHLKGILSFYRSAGFSVALDDIGSGWSSLNMLHEYIPDYVKLDMDLCRDIDQNPMKQVIVEKVIEIARKNNIRTIAEGIETQQEADFLINKGADYLQGYLFGKPEAKSAKIDALEAIPAQ